MLRSAFSCFLPHLSTNFAFFPHSCSVQHKFLISLPSSPHFFFAARKIMRSALYHTVLIFRIIASLRPSSHIFAFFFFYFKCESTPYSPPALAFFFSRTKNEHVIYRGLNGTPFHQVAAFSLAFKTRTNSIFPISDFFPGLKRSKITSTLTKMFI